jgi:hypothetical protein
MTLRQAQSLFGSAFEALTNVAVGFILALLAQRIVFPLFGIVTTIATDTGIAAIFTALSLVRSYLVRRIFEKAAAMRCRISDKADARP